MPEQTCDRCSKHYSRVQCVLCSRRICNGQKCLADYMVDSPTGGEAGSTCRDCITPYAISKDRDMLGDTGERQVVASDALVDDEGEAAEDALILELEQYDLRGDREGARIRAEEYMSTLSDRVAVGRFVGQLFGLGVRLRQTAETGGH